MMLIGIKNSFYCTRPETVVDLKRREVRTESGHRTFTVRPKESALRMYVFVLCLMASVTLFLFSSILHMLHDEIAPNTFLLTQLLIAALQDLAIFTFWSQLYVEKGERLSTHLNLCLFFASKLTFWFMFCVWALTNVTLEDAASYLSALDFSFKTVFDLCSTIVLGQMELEAGMLMLTYYLEWGRRGLIVANKSYPVTIV